MVLAAVAGLALVTVPAYAAPPEGASGAGAGPFVLRMPGVAGDSSSGATFDPGVMASGIRVCRFLPGVSQAAILGPAATEPTAAPAPSPVQSAVVPAVTQSQLETFDGAAAAVVSKYVDPGINGLGWGAVTAQYRAMVQAGMTNAEFDKLMKLYIGELEDGHSYYLSAQEVIEQEEAIEHGASLVGIGASISGHPDGSATVIYVIPGSPAQAAGIRPHDLLLTANGLPISLPDGTITTRGEAGTPVTVQVKRGKEPAFPVVMVRAAISAPATVDYCTVAGTRIAYIFLPTFLDASITGQVRAALQKLTASGPLSGVVIDNRMNGGGLSTEATGVLGFFTSGNHGAYVSRTSSTPFQITAEPIGNSQTVPLVVLVGEETVSFGEIFSGVLDRAGRATIIGVRTNGNVELLNPTNFSDGSRIWLAQSTFQPVGLPAGAWEESGIVPDFVENGQWHEFTELDDPGLARAIAVLSD